MTVDRQHGKMVFSCDSCSETIEPDDSTWAEAWSQVKAEGWTARQIVGEWMHFCEKCSRTGKNR